MPYDLLYFISAYNDCHPQYVRWLIDKRTLSIQSVNEILSRLEGEKKLLYDESYIESLYFDYYESIKELLVEHDACLTDLMRWAKMFRTWPTQYTIRVRGREFIIVHAGYIEDLELLPDPKMYSGIKDFNLYAREDAFIYGGKAHATIIAGHTPTIIRHSFAYNCGKVFRYHDEENDCVLYDVDCGSVFRYWGEKEARLACICLEDESITYL